MQTARRTLPQLNVSSGEAGKRRIRKVSLRFFRVRLRASWDDSAFLHMAALVIMRHGSNALLIVQLNPSSIFFKKI
jgi:hypothetical protein